jgi:hypothetical protein
MKSVRLKFRDDLEMFPIFIAGDRRVIEKGVDFLKLSAFKVKNNNRVLTRDTGGESDILLDI